MPFRLYPFADASMELAYNNGKGRVFEGMLQWLSSSDDDLQVTAVLAMANFARSGMSCLISYQVLQQASHVSLQQFTAIWSEKSYLPNFYDDFQTSTVFKW